MQFGYKRSDCLFLDISLSVILILSVNYLNIVNYSFEISIVYNKIIIVFLHKFYKTIDYFNTIL